MSQKPILIIGAGVVGLMLAQAFKKEGIPFINFERDSSIDVRGHGWGLTIHWALSALQECLPPSLFDRLKTIQVDPEQGKNDTGQFLFLNIANAEPVFQIPPAPRLRINREKFRKLLLDGIDVQWNKTLSGFKTNGERMIATFQDGSNCEGSLLLGADGANSKLRRLLCPETGALQQLPIRFLGVTLKLKPAEIAPLRALGPLLFQGCHPETSTYLWYSMLETPEINNSQGTEAYYLAQINISWPVQSKEEEVPATNEGKLKRMKSLADVFETRLRNVVQNIPRDTEVVEIKLADWPCLAWPNFEGKVTLIGDAAHAMTMYRGEAANHGITDVKYLRDLLTEASKANLSPREAVGNYEEEMRGRSVWAVMISRQACLDAHDFKRLNKDSAILARRAR